MRVLVTAVALLIGATAMANDGRTVASATPRTRAECASLFLKLDINGDGRISRAEGGADPVIASALAARAPGEPDDLTAEEFMAVCMKPAAAHGPAH